MKIMLATLDWPDQAGKGGGVGNYYYQLRGLAPQSMTIDVLTPQGTGAGVINNDFYRKNAWPHWEPIFSKLRQLVTAKNYDYYWAGQIWPVGFVCYILSLYFPANCKYFVSLHGLDIQIIKKNPFKKFLAKQILKRAQLITVNSEYTKKLVQEVAPKVDCLVIYPTGNKLPEPTTQGQQELIQKYQLTDKKVMISVGRLVKRKGQDLVIKALNDLSSEFPNLVYVCLGNGPEKESLEKLALTTARSGQIVFINQAADQDLANWYSIANIFVLPVKDDKNDPEGFGMVYLEANHFGLPVIGSRAGGIPEAIADNHSGLLIKPDDLNDLKNKIKTLLTDQALVEQLKKLGQDWSKKFTWANSANKLFNAIKKL